MSKIKSIITEDFEIFNYKFIRKISEDENSKILLVENINDINHSPQVMKLTSLHHFSSRLCYQNEVKILSLLDHHNITPLLNSFQFQTQNEPFGALILPPMETTLLDYILTNDHLTLYEAKKVFRALCKAIDECHSKGIVHLDIKPDNVLISLNKEGKINHVQLCGFGKAQNLQITRQIPANFGTQFYRPPEAAHQLSINSPKFLSHNFLPKKADIYSLAVTLCLMLTGLYPVVFGELNRGSFNFSRDYLMTKIHDWLCIHLIQSMLHVNPQRRPNVKSILSHPWLV